MGKVMMTLIAYIVICWS